MTDQHPISTAPTALAHETDEKPHGSVEDEKHGHEHHILDSADVHQKGMDDGAVALEGQDLSYTPEEARRVRWKADLRMYVHSLGSADLAQRPAASRSQRGRLASR
jgi:hypothetical protein